MAAMRQSFERTGNGVLCIRRRALAVDCLLEPLWQFESDGALPAGLALVAVGGFGRKELFPSSDVDLLYLCANEQLEQDLRETIRGCNQAMWDLGLRASPMIRCLKECDRYDPNNVEFTLSLLDRRFIAGDHGLYQNCKRKHCRKSRYASGVASCINLPNWPAHAIKNTATPSSISNPISKSVRAACAITSWPTGSTC